ncbi:MAG: ABC transporter substrate-binding protein [Desulfobacterales bacterium]|uniref:ABC transporter substrate-binding protein n=1 Tax=Candidatus Desulfatibia vada TaxID=2841696 RepID=A0A8J6TPY4_9BACT|nr:ABC transporter substrate-binding protein [Candidatus Desulfatibia vada]MBL6972579.1 ABC transporter substrate-binding protein [Desulfobacterales bacterium]
MKYKRKIMLLLMIISMAVGFILFPQTGQSSEPLVIGVPHSEKFPYAAMMKNSFEMALAVINKEGGIKGRPLKLVYADDQGKLKAGERIIAELVKKTGAIMLVGAYQSSNTVYMARVADKLNRPFLISTAADDRVTQRKWRNVYRLNAPASEYAKGLEDFLLKKIKPKSMAIVYENSPYGTGGAMRMMWFCRENNIDISAIEPYHKERLRPDYFQRITDRLKKEPPDVIYMVSYLKDAALLVKTIREAKINSLLLGGAGGFTHKKFINTAGKLANNLLTATLWTHQLQYPGTKAYYDQYIKKYSIPPDYHGAEAYSALLVAADVLKRAESFSPESIRAALDNTDMMTLFGPVKFKSYGKFQRQNSLPTQVLQIINGNFECVWPEDLATAAFIAPPAWRGSD